MHRSYTRQRRTEVGEMGRLDRQRREVHRHVEISGKIDELVLEESTIYGGLK
jgi:hypothetical protein